MSIDLEYLDQCLCCGGLELFPYINLGSQPPCNALASKPTEVSAMIPLKANVCQNCWHSQLAWVPKDMGILWKDYPYRTGVSTTLITHYHDLANRTLTFKPDARNVLDIGCNDYTLLLGFKAVNPEIKIYGIDPFPVETEGVGLDGFWTMTFDRDKPELLGYPEFDLITATNVLAHNKNPKEFLRAAGDILAPEGILVLEFPYARNMVMLRQFDTIYHEHVSYFNATSIKALLEGTGLMIWRADKTANHGGSLTLFLKHCPVGGEAAHHSLRFGSLLQREQEIKQLTTYSRFASDVGRVPQLTQILVDDFRKQKYGVVGFGASGKSSVFLNYTNIKIDYIVDETPTKIGKFTPGITHFPIVPMQRIQTDKRNLAIIIFAWNCLEECVNKLRIARNEGLADRIILYTPSVAAYKLNDPLLVPLETIISPVTSKIPPEQKHGPR